jgi:hypothetical protein
MPCELEEKEIRNILSHPSYTTASNSSGAFCNKVGLIAGFFYIRQDLVFDFSAHPYCFVLLFRTKDSVVADTWRCFYMSCIVSFFFIQQPEKAMDLSKIVKARKSSRN